MKIFRKSCLILITALTMSHFALADWVRQPSPASTDLRNVSFINPSTGWISGDSGTIFKTTNGGQSWNRQFTGIKTAIVDMYFLNERTGWAVAWFFKWDSAYFPGTLILKTTNGGNNWNGTMFPDSNSYKAAVYMFDSLHVLLGGIPYFMHYTTDGGFTWLESQSDSAIINNYPIFTIKFADANNGYAVGGIRDLGGLVWTTSNSGLTWQPRFLGPDPINDIYLINADSTIAVSGDFKFGANIYTTQDNGRNWYETNLGYFGICNSIDFRTPFEGWITLGYGQRFFKSTDGGQRWVLLETPDSSAVFDFDFINDTLGWAVGAAGAILKFDTTITSVISQLFTGSPSTFELYPNYPNPFNPTTVIRYNVPEHSNGMFFVRLIVSDVLGRTVSILVNELQESGYHSVNFDASGLSSGIYFYTVELTSETSQGRLGKTRKMLLLR